MSGQRRADQCPHRQPAGITDQTDPQLPTSICNLISRLQGRLLVPETICQACCTFPIPELPDMNPVVASHVYTTAAAALQQSGQTPQQRLSQLQLTEFCQTRLACGSPEQLPLPLNDPSRLRGKSWLSPRRWLPPSRYPSSSRQPTAPRIGLAGWNSGFGLGHVNRDLAKQLGVHRWLAPILGESARAKRPANGEYASPQASPRELDRWLNDLEVVLFVEQPPFQALPEVARQRRIPLVCIPNWEWLTPGLPWLADIDLMLCPARYTASLLQQWKVRFGFTWQIECIPWPIDVARFAFRQRQVCERFLYVGGRGGSVAHEIVSNVASDGISDATSNTASDTASDTADQPPRSVRRKGLELVLQAAEKLSTCQFLVFTTEPLSRVPANVEVRGYVTRNALLYEQGDVCVQPSYWEGTGLPLLECQAAGLPLVTTDIAPANEYDPLAVIPIRGEFLGSIEKGYTIPIPIIDANDLSDVLRGLQGRPIAAASRSARRFVETHHAWSTVRPRMLDILTKLVDCRVH